MVFNVLYQIRKGGTMILKKKKVLYFYLARSFFIPVMVLGGAFQVLVGLGNINDNAWLFLGYMTSVVVIVSLCWLGYILVRKAEEELEKEMASESSKNCMRCQIDEGLYPEVPYCEDCLAVIVNEINGLASEAKKRIELAKELGFEKQVEGAKQWFFQNLPEPIKSTIHQAVLSHLRGYFPQVEPFEEYNRYDGSFQKVSIDSAYPERNIPSEGLEILKRIAQKNPELLTNDS